MSNWLIRHRLYIFKLNNKIKCFQNCSKILEMVSGGASTVGYISDNVVGNHMCQLSS